jgi:hypothetical protein
MKLLKKLEKAIIYKLTKKPECYVHVDNPKTLQEKRQVQYNKWCRAKGIFNGSYLPQNPNTLTHKGWRETTNPKNPKNKEYQRKSTGQMVRYDPPRPRRGTNVIEDEHYHWYTEPSFEKRRKQDTKQKFYDRYGKICADRSDESHLAPLDKKYIKK